MFLNPLSGFASATKPRMTKSATTRLTLWWATAALASCLVGCGSDTSPSVDGGSRIDLAEPPRVDLGPWLFDLGDLPVDLGVPDLGPTPVDLGPGDMGPRCGIRPTGDSRWPQYALPGTAGHPRVYQVQGPADSETVVDCITGLEWQRTVDAASYTQPDAVAYCGGLALGGYTDWRLPSRIELMTLVDYSIAEPGPMIDAAAFPSTPSAAFWTSSAFAGFPPNPWFILFDTGESLYNDITPAIRARCVR